ncbi:HigA family addiction module antitoxin [Enterobacter sp. CC120223-11]|uniref:HigA family addiction module antitoxin n=1 Tax=Enterobacter sp. CC120223-11 TaxID=1378073 RepID=UPI000BDA6FB0|nr:HigA family addiction module antitoxin [Enterobacter sp. CC120223-11]SNY79841.1 addiction module antidote protein, HigA family [Enterobacter sp. CC120223-11]
MTSTKKNIPHPGVIVHGEMEYLGITDDELAQQMSLEVEILRLLIEGKCSISEEIAKKLEQAIGSTAEQWLRIQETYNARESLN